MTKIVAKPSAKKLHKVCMIPVKAIRIPLNSDKLVSKNRIKEQQVYLKPEAFLLLLPKKKTHWSILEALFTMNFEMNKIWIIDASKEPFYNPTIRPKTPNIKAMTTLPFALPDPPSLIIIVIKKWQYDSSTNLFKTSL